MSKITFEVGDYVTASSDRYRYCITSDNSLSIVTNVYDDGMMDIVLINHDNRDTFRNYAGHMFHVNSYYFRTVSVKMEVMR